MLILECSVVPQGIARNATVRGSMPNIQFSFSFLWENEVYSLPLGATHDSIEAQGTVPFRTIARFLSQDGKFLTLP